MQRYDAIVVGAGPAGLSLAEALLDGPMRGRQVLVVDAPSAAADRHAFAWWSDRPLRWDDLAWASWSRVAVRGPGQRTAVDLGAWRYRVIDGEVLQRTVRTRLQGRAGLTWIEATVDGIEDGLTEARVVAGAQAWHGSWVFDSRYRMGDHVVDDGAVDLRQAFSGWWIRAPRPLFDPDLPVLMDLNLPQDTHLRFLYVLPRSPTEALVEGVSMGPDASVPDVPAWVARNLGDDVEVTRAEGGITPMTTGTFPRRAGRRVLKVGVAGGRIKPSTGYALARILADTDAIVASLQRHGHPFDLPGDGWLWRFLDAVLLDVLARRPAAVARGFLALFAHNTGPRVLRFLDQRAGVRDVLAVGLSLPWWPFLRAMVTRVAGTVARRLRPRPALPG